MKKIIQLAVNNPVTVIMMVCAILLLGKISYDKLGVDLLPSLNNPSLYIELDAGDRPPEEIEKKYVKNIEAMVIRQRDITAVSSVIKAGTARITVEYTWGKDMDEAFLDLQKAIGGYSANQEIKELNISQNDPNSAPVVLIGLSHPNIEDMAVLRKAAESYIRNELVRVEGVADVQLSGQEYKKLNIKTDPYKLNAFKLTINDIAGKIEENNKSISGGKVSELGLQYIVKGVSNLNNEGDFETLIVGYKPISTADASTSQNNTATNGATKAPIYLKDVAVIEFENTDPENIVRVNGKRSIGLSVYKEMRYNTVQVVDNISKQLTRIEQALPGYEFDIVTNQGTFIKNSIGEVKDTALLGIVLAIIVLFVFLRRFGTTLIVSIAIPISLVATFNLMYFGGLTLNIMTLGGMALGAGMLVDNAIVVIESIFRNHEKGDSVTEAAVNGTAQVAGAVTASTLTTIVVFLPIVYLHGASGELFKDQAWTVTFSLLSSLFVAIFTIPMLYAKLFGKKSETQPVKQKASIEFKQYGKLLTRILQKKGVVLTVSFLVILGAFLLVPLLKTEFMPKSDNSTFIMQVKLPEGTMISRTASTIESLENIIYTMLGDSTCTIYSHIGKQTGNGSSVLDGDNTASLKVILNDKQVNIDHIISQLTPYTEDIQGAEIAFVQDNNTLNTLLENDGAPIVVEVKGEELEDIALIVDQAKGRIQSIPELFNVSTSIENGNPEVSIMLDRTVAGINNLTISSVIEQIKQQLSGRTAGAIDYQGESRDIEIKLPDIELSQLDNIIIKGGDKEYRLSEIATIMHTQSPKEIIRRNQTRLGKVTANIDENTSLDVAAQKVSEVLKDIELPSNYTISITGEEAKRKEAMDSLLFALFLSVVLVYMVLASQFESFLHPFTILLTIPLAVVGAILAFLVTGTTVNIMGVIGVVMLVGIAVNNSIILVDRINQLKQTDLTLIEAIAEAGQQRIRPIFMTTITTILALLPLTFGFGDGAALRAPMAIAVIGGLITSTLMSLLVIPCLYLTFERLKSGRRN